MTAARSKPWTALLIGVVAAGALSVAGCAGVNPANSVGPEDAGAGMDGDGVHISDAASDASGGGFGGMGGATSGGAGGSTATQDGGAPADAATDAPSDATGAGGALGGCSLTPTAVSPPDLSQLETYPGARARVSVSARGARAAPVAFTWEVLWTGVSPALIVATTGVDPPTNSVIEFPVDHEGTYRITPRVADDASCPIISWPAVAQRAVFVLRTTVDGLLVHEDRFNLHAGNIQDAASVALGSSVDTRLAPVRANGTALPSYVRVSRPGSDLRVEGDTTHGSLTAQLSPATAYDVLVVPDEDLAPALFRGTPATLQAQTLVVDQGLPIHATMRDGLDRPLAGARMIMRQGELPSTVGTSDAAGLMTLWARAGSLSVSLVPPMGSGLPQANADVVAGGAPGVVLAPAGALDVRMAWNAVTTAPLTATVRAPDGTTPVAGAQVRATSRGAPVRVGTLTAQAPGGPLVTLPAVGSTDVQVVADASGVATFPALPVGDLTLTVVPPASMVPDDALADTAITSAPVTMARGGTTQNVTLAKKVKLAGVVLPVADTAGALITGIDTSITAPGRVATATVGADGGYTLAVDPGRAYQLILDPAPGATMARAMLGVVTSGTVDTTVSTRSLPVVHAVTGTVTRAANAPVANARVQVFCPSWSAQCLNPNFALADVVTDRDGRFALRLPEPARN